MRIIETITNGNKIEISEGEMTEQIDLIRSYPTMYNNIVLS